MPNIAQCQLFLYDRDRWVRLFVHVSNRRLIELRCAILMAAVRYHEKKGQQFEPRKLHGILQWI